MLSNIRKDQHTKAGFYRQKSPRKIASKTRKNRKPEELRSSEAKEKF
jgi:hypothetical protein